MQASVAETFRDGTVLVTGSTGFLGKILTEKLLRSCPVQNIMVLVRGKKGLTADQRISKIYKTSLFDRLRREKPNFRSFVKIVDGDLDNLPMSLSSTDRDWMIRNVNFIFHCAATVKFNEPLEIAVKVNTLGTANLLKLAKEMKNLKGFVHVSTAYSHCLREEIEEKFYSMPITFEELNMEKPTNDILENWPNTYTFTKAMTEHLISKNEDQLPISIFRPSIIGCTKSEPDPGWMDNMNGPTGIMMPMTIGFLRTAPIDRNKISDIIPVDYTANALICVMWDTVNRYQDFKLLNEEPKIYNFVSSVESPLTWGGFIDEMYNSYLEVPPLESIWYFFCILTVNLLIVKVLRFLLHRIPGAFMDLLLIFRGNNPRMLKLYAKLEHLTDLLYTFTSKDWKFDNSNTRKMWSLLNKEDREMFWYSFENFNWKQYIKIYIHGIRKHIHREDQSNLKKALAKNRRLYWLHIFCIVSIVCLVLQLCNLFVKCVYE